MNRYPSFLGCFALATYAIAIAPSFASAERMEDSWSQFRGPNGSGVSLSEEAIPAEVGPERNVVWKIDLAPGVSSPVISGNRLYVTAEKEGNKLVTVAISTKNGDMIWEVAAPLGEIERTDKRPAGRLATPTPATDGEHVVVFFGSSGLLCYDTEGKQLWHRPMGPFHNTRGATSSPVIVENRVILVEDHETGSFIAAFDIKTGKTLWRTERTLFNRSYGTPIVWEQGGSRFVVTVGSGLVTTYDVTTGHPAFFIQGTSAVANPTPVVGEDGMLYVASANPGPKREFQPSYSGLLEDCDANQDGQLTKDELPNGLFQSLFSTYDADGSGDLAEAEYQALQRLMGTCRNGMIAVKPGGKTIDRTDSQLAWHAKKSIPRTASPIYFQGHLYMINDGGVFASVNAATGELVKSGRTPARGKFFSSPVLGDGKIYFASDRGEVVVVSATPEWKLLASADFEEPIYPTPAIHNGRVYLRTESQLFCFGSRPKARPK